MGLDCGFVQSVADPFRMAGWMMCTAARQTKHMPQQKIATTQRDCTWGFALGSGFAGLLVKRCLCGVAARVSFWQKLNVVLQRGALVAGVDCCTVEVASLCDVSNTGSCCNPAQWNLKACDRLWIRSGVAIAEISLFEMD